MEKQPIEEYRRAFPVTRSAVYLDNAGVAPISTRVKEAVNGYLAESSESAAFKYPTWADRVESVRSKLAGMIAASPGEIAFIRSTSHGLSLVAGGIDWKQGDNVITYKGEFPANLYPWVDLGRRGVELRLVELREGRILLDDIEALMDQRTRLVALSWVQFATGFRMDLSRVGALCRNKGIFFCVDAIQGLGAISLDVVRDQVDFLAADGHKWMLGPEGIGVFYCRKELCEFLHPALIGWKSVRTPFSFESPAFELRSDAQRFEEGSQNLMGIFGLGASIDLLREFGIDRIEERVHGLGEVIISLAEQRGFEVRTPKEQKERGGIVTFVGPFDAGYLREALKARRVMVNARAGGLRISPHFYNTEEEIRHCFLEIDRIRESRS